MRFWKHHHEHGRPSEEDAPKADPMTAKVWQEGIPTQRGSTARIAAPLASEQPSTDVRAA